MPRKSLLDPATWTALAFTSLHALCLLHFAPRNSLSSPVPFLTGAFSLNAYRAARALQASPHHFSAYDPRVLAGQISGVHELFGSRILSLGTVFLAHLGVPPPTAFNALALFLHALLPLVGYAAARAFGAERRVAAATLALWSALGFVDSVAHYAWFSGRIEWILASAVVVLQAALAARALSHDRARLASVALSGFVAALLHPVVACFGALVVVFVIVTSKSAGQRARIVAAVVLPLGLVWLLLCRSDPGTSEPVAAVFHVGPSSLLWDFLEIPGPGYAASGSSRTLLRVLCFGGGALALVRGGGARTRSTTMMVALATAFAVLSYGGDLLPVAWPVDPYFFVIGATFALSLPALAFAFAFPWADVLRRSRAPVRVALAVALAVVVPRTVRTVLTYAPELLPARVVRGPSDLAVSALGGVNEPFPDPLGYDLAPLAFGEVTGFLVAHGAAEGRVLTDDAALAGFLALETSLSVLGPLGERGTPSASADPSRLFARPGNVKGAAEYIERYAVSFVVLNGPPGPFDAQGSSLESSEPVAGYRVRRVARPSGFVRSGVARVAPTNLSHSIISVNGTAGPRVTLRFHFDERLGCRPGCAVEREAVEGDPAGFVSVPNPPVAFEIYER